MREGASAGDTAHWLRAQRGMVEERKIALDMRNQAAPKVVCEGRIRRHVTMQVREIGYLSALSDNARGCECWRHCAPVMRAARWGQRKDISHKMRANRRRQKLFAGAESYDTKLSRCVRLGISAHRATLHEGASAGDTAHWLRAKRDGGKGEI